MKKLGLLLAMLIMCHSNIFAALPPLAEGIREIQAMLAAKEFGELLGMGDVIQEIKRVDSGYVVTTNNQEMLVEVIYSPSGIGPAKFDLQFNQPIKLAEKISKNG